MSVEEALVEGLHEGVVLLELDGTIRAMSSTARALLGLESGYRGHLTSLVAEPTAVASQLSVWATGDAALPAVLTPSATGVALRVDGRRLPGTEPPLLVLRLERRDEAARDFSALRGSLEQLREEMRHRRTLELRNERLLVEQRAATARAERLNQAKGEFLRAVSHELRTPLNAISGWAQLLARPAGAESLARGVEVIQRNCEVQRRLIDDLVDLSRLASGELQLALEQVELMPVVQQAVASLASEAEAAGVDVVAGAEQGVGPMLVADPERLRQVVWNLLSNAIKYTPHGGSVRVHVSCQPGTVVLRVVDTGRGMEPGMAAKVFDPFWQATGRTEGLGMGLALVRQLVELHGGQVAAHSDGPGRGCAFTVRLPEEATAVVEVPTTDRRVSPLHGPRLIGARVLLVEDHDDSRELLARLLEGEAAEVTVCADATCALQHLGRVPFDLVVSDVRLVSQGDQAAELDGCELIEALRRSPGINQQVPAIALTAFGSEADRARTLASGFQQHVLKPVDAAVLVRAAQDLLGENGAGAAAQQA